MILMYELKYGFLIRTQLKLLYPHNAGLSVFQKHGTDLGFVLLLGS